MNQEVHYEFEFASKVSLPKNKRTNLPSKIRFFSPTFVHFFFAVGNHEKKNSNPSPRTPSAVVPEVRASLLCLGKVLGRCCGQKRLQALVCLRACPGN